MRFGLDYGGTLSPAAHHSIGSTFACRYLRELWAIEVNELIGGGVDVVLIHERLADAALGGHAYGVRDAKDALGSANGFGAPTHVPIYFAVDFDETPGQAATVADYFRGVASVIGLARTGAYGGYWTVSRLFDAGLIKWGWQTYAWSGSQLRSALPTVPVLATIIRCRASASTTTTPMAPTSGNGRARNRSRSRTRPAPRVRRHVRSRARLLDDQGHGRQERQVRK